MSEHTSAETRADISIAKHQQEAHFAMTVDGKHAGVAEYVEETGHRSFVHTEVDDAFAGQGLAPILVRHALDATREDGLRIRATCSYVRKFLAENHDWDDLVDAGTTEEDAADD